MSNSDDQLVSSLVEDLNILGYAKISQALSEDALAELRSCLAFHAKRCEGRVYPGYTAVRPDDPQIFNLQNKDRCFIDALGQQTLEKVLMAKLNDAYYTSIPADCPNYILGEYIARSSGAPLRLHIDSWMPATGTETWMMQAAIALEDRDCDDGCTVVVPGSHLSGKFTERNYKKLTPIPLKAGDIALWDSRLWHGALPIKNPGKVWVLIATFQRWWVKPRFDMVRGLPPEIEVTLSKRQKALLGFCSQPPVDENSGTDARQGYDSLDRDRMSLR